MGIRMEKACGDMTWYSAMHRAASLSLAVAIGWTASTMWMNCSRQVRDDDLDDYLQETAHRAVEAGGVHDEVDVEGERERIESGALAYLKANPECDVKMVFLVRTDLKMTKGKMCAQVAHAAVDAVDIANEEEWELMEKWEECGCTKVCVKVESEDQLLEMAAAATARGLVTSVIEDAGRTQVEAGSRTVCGIGPGPAKLIDEVAGMLKLL